MGGKVSVRKIAISGLEKSERVLLKAAIQTASGFETGPWEFTDEISVAQALILDPNSTPGREVVESFTDRDDAPLLVGTTNSNANANAKERSVLKFMIEQPFVYNNVLTALRQIDRLVKDPVDNLKVTANDSQDRKEQNKVKVEAKTKAKVKVENKKEIKHPVPEVSEVVSIGKDQIPEDSKLHHLIKEIISENKSIEISHPDFPSIKICTEKHWFIFSGDLDNQTDLFRRNVGEFTIEDKGDEIRKQAFSGSFPKALWELIYTATLSGTEGVLLNPLLPEDHLHLIELPEFEKAPHSNQHIAIADYMISHSATAGEIAKNLEIEISTVNDFCNACQAIGLLIATGEPQNRLFRLINKIVEQKKSIEITHPDFPTIDICAEKDWFIFSEDLNKHTEMFCVDVGEFSFENRGDEIRKQAFGGAFPKSLWELVYTATMFGTEGKLLSPLQATDRLSLIKKPDFDYVKHTKEHVILADYMAMNSDTVHDVAVNTEVDLREVIDFSNMCQSIHLIERNAVEQIPFSEDEGDITSESNIEHTESKASKLIHSITNIGKKV